MDRLIIKLSVTFILVLVTLGLIALNLNLSSYQSVAEAQAIAITTPSPVNIMTNFTTEPVVTASPSAELKVASITKLKKKTYTIAAIGDSMIETMGDSLEYLSPLMKAKYPRTGFVFYNYGIGSENVVEALARFDNRYSYKNKNYPPISDINADVIIVGSYAYNPLYVEGQSHWLKLAELIQKAKVISPKVYVLTEIAPLKNGFGEGPGGVNWPPEIVEPHLEKIITGLNDAMGLAKELKVGLIDAFNPSKGKDGYGQKELVSTNDGIHPSIEGHKFEAKIIADTLTLDP